MGRNGSGKSSLSDALEVLLTGHSARWAVKKAKVWQDGWRNLHHGDPTRIEARVVVEGQSGFTTITRDWPAAADLGASTVTVTRMGKSPAPLDSLGWQDALVAYRPFLSYSELGGLLEDGPSKLFDALNAILGLDDVSVAVKALAEARLEIERRAKQTAAELLRLHQMLEASPDERAGQLLASTGRVPDLERTAALLEASLRPAAEGGQLELLRRLAALELPTAAEVAASADRLTSAARGTDAAAASDSDHARELARLLDEAVAFHQRHGDGDCPVCGQARGLSAAWPAHADAERARLGAEAKAADEAHAELLAATAALRSWLRPPPAALSAAASVGVVASATLAAWQAWAAGPATDTTLSLATHMRGVEGFRHDALVVRSQAEKLLTDAEED